MTLSKLRQAWPSGKITGNMQYKTITKHSIEILPKPIHTGELVFLKVVSYHMNLFLAFPNKIRHFSATFRTFFVKFRTIFVYILVKTLALHTF